MLKWCRDLPIMLKNSPSMQPWLHLTLPLLYSKGVGGATLLLFAYAHFLSSTTNLTLGIEICNCMGHK